VKETIKDLKIKRFQNAGYGIFNHSAVEICNWTKSSLVAGPSCYKQKFYGIEAHRCIEMSPAFNVCTERCVFCWRPNEFYDKIDFEWNKPKEIIEKLVELRKQKLSGFFGNEKALKGKLKDAYYKFPNHWAISLSGEPTLYPYLPEFIKILRKNKNVRSIFLVSNGTEYEMIKKLSSDIETQPVQMYISMNSWDFESFLKINKPVGNKKEQEEKWENYLKSLSILNKFERSVLRFTVIKKINDKPENFFELINLAKPDFIEVKSYMHIGLSRKRLSKENMLNFEEVKAFAKELEKAGYEIIDEYKRSLIVLLKRKDSKHDQFIVFNDFGEEITLNENTPVYDILKFKKAIRLLKELGINYWEKDYLPLIHYGKEKYEKIKEFLLENYDNSLFKVE
jgi:tRNA wybutosine-synthesizing protein 1